MDTKEAWDIWYETQNRLNQDDRRQFGRLLMLYLQEHDRRLRAEYWYQRLTKSLEVEGIKGYIVQEWDHQKQKIERLTQAVRTLNGHAEENNKRLSELHWIWRSGDGRLFRKNAQNSFVVPEDLEQFDEITEDMVQLVEGYAKRMRSWYTRQEQAKEKQRAISDDQQPF